MAQGNDREDARLRMQGALLSSILAAGFMAGLDTVEDCMRDDALREFLGHTLLREIMPSMGLGRETLEPLAMDICREWERPAVSQPLEALLPNAVRAWLSQALPLLEAYLDREDHVPPCLCMGLSALIMLFSGVRRGADGGYALLKDGAACPVSEEEDILFSFSRLSCDMPPEALAYAALSDRAVWDRDLRALPGLEDCVADQLRDLQLVGLREALARACAGYGE